MRGARSRSWRPVILVAAAITVLGYGTLVTSSYPPLRSIGVVSAVSVATLAVASVLVLPALLDDTKSGIGTERHRLARPRPCRGAGRSTD